jgi:hypothetical protein
MRDAAPFLCVLIGDAAMEQSDNGVEGEGQRPSSGINFTGPQDLETYARKRLRGGSILFCPNVHHKA